MTKAPESLYVEISQYPDEWTGTAEQVTEFDTEYTRTGTIPALLAAEREKALREAAAMVATSTTTNYHMSNCILALIDAETDPQPDLSGTSEPQAAKPSAGERLIDSAKGARAAHHIEDARVMAEYACCVIDANSQCDESACCDGRECGCGGETVHEHMKAMIRAKAGIKREGNT